MRNAGNGPAISGLQRVVYTVFPVSAKQPKFACFVSSQSTTPVVGVPGDAGAIGVVPLARPAEDDQNTAEENQRCSDHPNQIQMNLSKKECGE
jgi:hypothetical protein